MTTPEVENVPDLNTKVFQAIGAASACWENLAGAGVFDSDRAKQVADDLLTFIRQNYEPRFKPAVDEDYSWT